MCVKCVNEMMCKTLMDWIYGMLVVRLCG